MIPPLFACGSMHFSAGAITLIYSILGGWMASLVLVFVNPVIIGFTAMSARQKSAHFALWAVYVISGLTAYRFSLKGLNGEAWLIPILGIPVTVISHFVALLWMRKQNSLRKKMAKLNTTPEPARGPVVAR